MAVPPPAALTTAFFSFEQLQRSWYMFFFQHPLADIAVPMDDLVFIDRLWADWSPGYDASEDLPRVKDCLRDPANLAAALGYYRATLSGVGVDPALDEIQAKGTAPLERPTLYLHGATDGCMGVDLAPLAERELTAAGSRMDIVEDAGHFLHVERPEVVNSLVVDFVSKR